MLNDLTEMKKIFLILLISIPSFLKAQNHQYIFEHLTVNDGLSRNTVSAIMQDKFGYMWFGTWNGLNRYDGYTFKVYKSDLTDTLSISNNRINYIYKDSTGTLWVETIDGLLNRYNYKTDDFTRFKPHEITGETSKQFVYQEVVQEKPGIVWYLEHGILTRENRLAGEIQTFEHDPFQSESLNDNDIMSLYIDNTKVLWIGTNSGGINKVDLLQKKFTNIRHHPLNENSIQSNIIREIEEDLDGNIWIGTRNKGICKYNSETNVFTRYFAGKKNNELPHNRIREISADSDGTIWIGASGNRPLVKYNHESNTFKSYLGGSGTDSPPGSTIYSIYEDDYGYLWIGSFDGLAIMNKRNEEFVKLRHNPIDNRSLSHNYVRVVTEDQQGNIWVGTELGGLNKVIKKGFGYDTVGDITFKRYLHEPGNLSTLSDNRVYSLCVDKNGTLWVGTAMGLDKFDPQTETFEHFNEQHGLPDVMIYGILNDENNNIWLSHNAGISRFSPDSAEIRFINYDKSDGLQGNEFSEDAYYKSSTGKLYFGGVNGLTWFHPDSIKTNPYKPQVIISDFKISNQSVEPGHEINGKVVLKKPIYETEELNLSYKHRTLSFEFASLHYANPDQNQFQYKLVGFEEEWNKTSSERRFATYSNLPKRHYELLVKGSNSDAVWNEEPVSLKINITPPFWRTVYFYIGLALLLGLITFALIKLRERKLKRDKLILEEKINKSQEEVDRQREEIIMQKNEIKLRRKDEKDLKWLNEGLAKFADIISENKNNIQDLTQNFLSNLVQFVEAEQGGIFLLNDDDENNTYLELTASYAYSKEKLDEVRVEIGEGQVGTCFKEGKHMEINNLPEGYTKITSGLGEKSPKYLVLFPLRMDETKLGILELASFKKLKGIKVVFLEKLCANITSILATEKANQRALKMYNDSIAQAEDLKSKEEELRQNLEEMQATQEELQRANMESKKTMKELEASKKEAEEREQELIEIAEQQAASEEELQLRIKNLEDENKRLRTEMEELKK